MVNRRIACDHSIIENNSSLEVEKTNNVHPLKTQPLNITINTLRDRSSIKRPLYDESLLKEKRLKCEVDINSTLPDSVSEDEDWPTCENFDRLQQEELPNVSREEVYEARAAIIRCMNEVMNCQFYKDTNTKAQKEFKRHLRGCNMQSYKLDRNTDKLPIETILLDDIKKSFQIESSTKLPPAKLWTHIDKNYGVADRRQLRNLPYIGDGKHKKDEKTFLECLHKQFIEGIHGAMEGCEKNISDFLAFLLLKHLHETEKLRYKDSNGKRLINFALFSLFPNKYLYSEVQDENFYINLCNRFVKNFTKRVSPSRKATFRSFMQSLCERCGLINCNYHTTHFKDLCKLVTRSQPIEVSGFTFNKPCSEHCGYAIEPWNVTGSPSLPNESLIALFKSRICSESNLCEITKRMNLACTLANYPEMTCVQYTCMAWHELKKPQPVKQFIRSDRHKSFVSLIKGGLNNAAYPRPCEHEGPCGKETNCPCFSTNSACTLFCRCAPSCKILFPGCRCKPGTCRTKHCPCFLAEWECNPKTCTTCNSDINNSEDLEHLCSNIALQNEWKKTVRVGLSTIKAAGYGLFIEQDVYKDELISEYTGEIITEAELERRGKIYDEINLSYTFNLIQDQFVVDAFHMGNAIRYANNKFAREKPNCRPRIVRVNGEQKIGIYANRALKAGEELFFDYGYTEEHHHHLTASSSKNNTRRSRKAIKKKDEGKTEAQIKQEHT